MENGHRHNDIVDLPITNGDFPIVMSTFTRDFNQRISGGLDFIRGYPNSSLDGFLLGKFPSFEMDDDWG